MMVADAHFAADTNMDSDRDSVIESSSEMDTIAMDNTRDTRKALACMVCARVSTLLPSAARCISSGLGIG